MKRRIAIVSTKQPGTNPRMRKNADAISEAGFDVLVLYAHNTPWADLTDQELFARVQWRHQRVGGHPKVDKTRFFVNRVKRKLGKWTGNADLQFCPAANAYLNALQRFNPHLVLGHNPGALPVLNQWTNMTGGPVLFDAEDHHSGECPTGSREQRRMAEFEQRHLSEFQWMTAASPLIGSAYLERFPHLHVATVNNAFDTRLQPGFNTLPHAPLKLIWFSQVVGPDRGIQQVLRHLSTLKKLRMDITLVGSCDADTKGAIEACITSDLHRIRWMPPCSEPDLMRVIAEHHIGLAIEPGFSPNNLIARSNKLYTYPLCGCWTLASRTVGQVQFYDEHPELGETLDLTDGASWTKRLTELSSSLETLTEQRNKVWTLAKEELNWETESQKLLTLVDEMLAS